VKKQKLIVIIRLNIISIDIAIFMVGSIATI